jgi:hypothetical protein
MDSEVARARADGFVRKDITLLYSLSDSSSAQFYNVEGNPV